MHKHRGRAALTWLAVGALVVLCAVLGFLQYRWIGEVSVAARERMRLSLQGSLIRLSQEFNSEITAACRGLLPGEPQRDLAEVEAEVAARYRPNPVLQSVAITQATDDGLVLRRLDAETGSFAAVEWPAAWTATRERLQSRLSGEPWRNRRPPGPPQDDERLVLDLPIMGMGARGGGGPFVEIPPPGPGPGPGLPRRRPAAWMIFEVNLQFLRETVLPELLHRYLGAGGSLEYQVEIVTRTDPATVIYQSDPDVGSIANRADASVALFEMQFEQVFRRRGPPGVRERPGPFLGAIARADLGRWQMFVRHRAGSLDAVVARARWRNLAVTGGVFVLMLASVAALIRFTRRAQRLAALQMDFVAGVSHELRTPLTVIHTAAYNLRGKLAANAAQVERYGELIQQESGRLKDLVEQVLRFAGANAGRVIRETEPLSVESVIDETIESSQAMVAGHDVETKIDAGLPPILGDRAALQQALQNLLSNAAKYGSYWIGVFASKAAGNGRAMVEIRVADRGPGIPEDEREHIFDPFFRGRRALEEQVHGTGLGLNLVKRIVEAHGGSVRVESEQGKGTEFIVRIPAAPAGSDA